MSGNPNKLTQFWQELRRRRVVHVIAVYASAAFVIIELVNNVYETLNLPDRTPAVTLIILAIGFPLAIIFSWIFDVTPEGVQKTKPLEEIETGETASVSSSWKIATYISVVIIIGLLAFNIFGGGNRVKIDESLAKSIAVLPFQNFSEDSEQDFMCLGLTDEIINHLFKLESFAKVASLTSVLTYRESEKRSTEIGEELGVSYILEGTYKKIGEDLRVSAQLIEANSDRHIWQQDYNRPYAQIMSLQSEIALQISDQINAFITDEEKKRIEKMPTTNLAAYEYFRRGIEIFYSHVDFMTAIGFFEKAIESDSTFALAYTYLAQCYQFIARYSFSALSSYEEAHSNAREAALKAYELDPYLGEALAVYGLILAEDWEIYSPEDLFTQAVSLSPGSPEVYSSYAQYLRWLGRYDESIKIGMKLIEMEPKNPMNYTWLSNYCMLTGQYEKSIMFVKEASKLNFSSNMIHLYLALNNTLMNNFDKATIHADSVISNITLPRDFQYLGAIGWIYGKAGDHESAQQQIEYLLELSNKQFVEPVYLSFAYTGLGEYENAFSCIYKAYELHTGHMIYLRAYADLFFKDLSSDPRYNEILGKMGFELMDIDKNSN